jgi:hypothetical protein
LIRTGALARVVTALCPFVIQSIFDSVVLALANIKHHIARWASLATVLKAEDEKEEKG